MKPCPCPQTQFSPSVYIFQGFKSNHRLRIFAVQVGLCAVLLAVVPTWASWGLSRRTAWALLATYLLFQVRVHLRCTAKIALHLMASHGSFQRVARNPPQQ